MTPNTTSNAFMSRVWHITRSSIQAFVRFNQGNRLRAAALSFYALLSIFPLIVLLLLAANQFLGETIVTEWAERLTQRFFPGELPTLIVSGISTVLQNEPSLNIISLVGLIWGASSFFSNLTMALDLTFNPDLRTRPMWRNRLSGSLIIVTLAILLALTVVIAYSLRVATRSVIENPGVVMRLISFVIPLSLDVFSLSLLFRYVPRTKLSWRAILIGSLFGGVGFELSRNAFAWYLENLASYSALYGSLGAVIALLIWMYLSLGILLYSAELTAISFEQEKSIDSFK